MDFNESLHRRFNFTGRDYRDNLPVMAAARHKWGNEGDYGRNGLAKLLRDVGARKGVEVGTNRGHSAVMWLNSNSKLHLTCIDPWGCYTARPFQAPQDDNYDIAVKRLKPYNAKIIRACSLDVVDDFEDGSLDFVYIDGNHEFDAVMQDLIRWAPKVKGHGLIMLHDYCTFWRAGIMAAVDAYTRAHRVDQWYITKDTNPTAFWQRKRAQA